MYKTILATAVVALLSSVAPVAFAQSNTTSSDTSAPAGHDMADESYDTVVEAIRDAANLDLSSITGTSEIRIVTLSSIMDGASDDMAELEETMVSSASEQEGLHTRIKENDALTAKLEGEGHDVENVISIRTNTDGSVVVYVDDRT